MYQPCNTENMRIFIAALRSDKFTQGRKKLESIEAEGLTRNCCLGVACRVATENGAEVRITQFPYTFRGTFYVSFDDDSSFLPVPVAKWLGLQNPEPDSVGWQHNPALLTEDGEWHTATMLNDDKEYTFNEIADAFERTFLTPESE